jgi:hypothetical protein
MSAQRSRHLLMQALVRGSASYGTSPTLNNVDAELEELGRCARLQPLKRQRLLQVIHASRAIDTCLASILRDNGITPEHGIGKMLKQLTSLHPSIRGYLDHSRVSAFRSSIANKRNHYAHNAASFPNSTQEVDKLVAEVHACMAMIL